MTLYLDRHKGIDFDAVTPRDMVEAHLKDLEVQVRYNVRYITGWANRKAGLGYCLVEAPSTEAATAVHREAHGMIADDIIEVDHRLIEEFLGNIADTPLAKDPESTDEAPSLRTILFTDLESSVAETQQLGDVRYVELLRIHNGVIRDSLDLHGGTEVKHMGDGIMASFLGASSAVQCAIMIQRTFASHNEEQRDHPFRVRIGISAGEPVTEHDDLFGTAVNLAKRVCDCAEPGGILVANVVRELCMGKDLLFSDTGETELRGFEDPVRLFAVSWRD